MCAIRTSLGGSSHFSKGKLLRKYTYKLMFKLFMTAFTDFLTVFRIEGYFFKK